MQHNNVALQVQKRCCTYYHPPQTLSRNKISLLQVEAACCSKLNWHLIFSANFFNLQQQNFVAWQCMRYGQQRFSACNATMLRYNLKKNVARITRPFWHYKMTGSKWAIELIGCWTKRTLYYIFLQESQNVHCLTYEEYDNDRDRNDFKKFLERLKEILNKLPKSNYLTTATLIKHLHK